MTRETPIWTTAGRAAPLFGLGEKRLVALIQAGDVVGYQAAPGDDARRSWYVDTRSLDAYHKLRSDEFQQEVGRIADKVRGRRG